MEKDTLLWGAGALAAAGAFGVAAANDSSAAAEVPVNSPLVKNSYLSSSLNEHVARRFSLCVTPALFNEINNKGWSKWLDEQFAMPESVDDDWKKTVSDILPYSFMSHTEATDAVTKAGLSWGGVDQHFMNYAKTGLTVIQGLMTKRHVNEIMTQLWLDHFSVPYNPKGEKFMTDLDRFMRSNALTNFPKIFKGVYGLPKIYWELDNEGSVAGKINENLARETMELYTVGVGNFTETDVEQLAILFSGWRETGYESVGIQNQNDHAYTKDPLTIMGVKYPNSNITEAKASLDLFFDNVLKSKNTAKMVAKKLAIRFVSDNPSDQLINALADAYMISKGDVKFMVKNLIYTDEFKQSIGAKWKRPFEYMGTIHRSLNPTWVATDMVRNHGWYYWYTYNPMDDYRTVLEQAGHKVRYWTPPNGYPDVAAYWMSTSSTLYPLNNTLTKLNENVELKYNTTWSAALNVKESDLTGLIANKIVRGLTGFNAPPEIRSEILKELNNKSISFEDRVKNSVKVTMASPLGWLR